MFSNKESTHLKQQVLNACQILVQQNLDSGPFGNVSIRIPNTQNFWVNPAGIIFQHLQDDHMVCVDINGQVVAGNGEPHPGTFIHREIYRLRPDIHAIVHTHSEATVLMSLLGCPIAPHTQIGAAFVDDQGIYTGFTGPVRTIDEGSAIATALGTKSVVIAKNHGIFTTGTTMHGALWDMILADMAAKIHLEAIKLGVKETSDLTPEFLAKSRMEVRDKQSELMWASYLRGS